MLATLASADALTSVSIVVKALTYATTLVAAGSVLIACALRTLDADMRRSLARMAALTALAAAALSVLRIPVRAGFLTGGALDGALDPAILGMVADSPLGASVKFRLVGLALILVILVPWRGARWIAVAGAVVVAASFALRGHALEEPRLLLGLLITVHVLGLAFWIGAFAPLARAAARREAAVAGPLAQEFGNMALWIVGAVVAAGALALVLFGAATPAALSTPYGQGFAVKLALFAGVLSLAALNKMRLTRALLAATPGAGARLRQSIRLEAVLIGAILLTTAAVTTVSSPPNDGRQALNWEARHAPLRRTPPSPDRFAATGRSIPSEGSMIRLRVA